MRRAFLNSLVLTALFLLGMIAASGAAADPIDRELKASFAQGAYMDAATAAEKRRDPDMLAFAARSLLAEFMTQEPQPDAALIERAARNAEAAIAIEPAHQEGRLQLAIALSLKGRELPAMKAWRAGHGQRAKALAEAVLQEDPANQYAHGLLAVWHVEVQRRGGALGASVMGASLEAARAHYRQAAALAADDVGVHWAYARALAALDAKAHQAEAAAAAQAAMEAGAQDHVERVMQERARALSAALASDVRAAQKLARELL